MTAAMAKPGNTAETFLVHFFGTGLADDRYVVQRIRARADGDIVPAPAEALAAKGRKARPAGEAWPPLAPGSFWMTWEIDWPRSVLIAKNPLDALSVLSLHLVPATRKGCAVVSAPASPATLPTWIEAWNPSRIFCAYDATPDGEQAAQRLLRKNNRVVRLRPALDGDDWNDMLMRERAGESMATDDRPID